MASENCILVELGKALSVYRQPIPATAEFRVIVEKWGEVTSGVSDAEFREAMLLVYRNCRYFPTPADLMGFVEEIRRRPPEWNEFRAPRKKRSKEEIEREQMMLRGKLTKEQYERNMYWLGKIRDMLASRP